jgi:LPXTG-site transpeptidase (sortase) family protein
MTTRLRPAAAVLILSALALAVALIGFAMAGSGSSVSSIGERPGDASQSSALDSLEPSPTAQPESFFGATSTRIDATVLPTAETAGIPTRVRIPALNIDAPVDVVALDFANRVEVPEDVQRTGWYRFAANPMTGQGSTVIVGHRDGVRQGAGAFFDLDKAAIGDRVTVITEDGSPLRYRIVARESFDKGNVPFAELFAVTGSPRLTLITCGGPFDATTLGYTDNVVVTAVPDVRNDAVGSR